MQVVCKLFSPYFGLLFNSFCKIVAKNRILQYDYNAIKFASANAPNKQSRAHLQVKFNCISRDGEAMNTARHAPACFFVPQAIKSKKYPVEYNDDKSLLSANVPIKN